METPLQIEHLFNKYLENRCTAKEVERLMNYFNADDRHHLHQLVLKEMQQPDDTNESNAIKPVLNDALVNIKHRIKAQRTPGRQSRLWVRLSVAATVLLCISAAGYFLLHKPVTVNQVAFKLNGTNITPGTNKAVLTLANGRQILLSNVKNGALAHEGNIEIHKTADGQVIYQPAVKNATSINGNNMAYNTITTPRGGQYQVILPDNTHVWLNAASSIQFPIAFKGATRQVTITGEAYFEVSKNKKMPFIVNAGKNKIEVLGTHFNVNAYADENTFKTTLLEGKVKVYSASSSAYLIPGQQSVIARGGGPILVNEADTQEAIAWKNGYFIFDHENIGSIMRKVSRWYDVEIDYQQNANKKVFNGTISKFNNITDVLDMLELTGSVHFKVDERRVTVMP